MQNLTIKQKLIGMTIILGFMVAGLSIFFVNRFAAMGGVYRQIPEVRVPQHQVSGAMAQVLLNCRININELYGVARNMENAGLFSDRALAKLNQYAVLERAMVEGHQDVGKEIEGLEGLTIPPCRKGGQIEKLTKDASVAFENYRQLCEKIVEKKKEELKLVNSIGWYDSKEESFGAVKTLVETGREMEALAKDQQTSLQVAELRQQEKNILQRADERYIKRLKDAYREFNAACQGEIKAAGARYYAAFESIFDPIITMKKVRDDLKALVRKDLRSSQKALDHAVDQLEKRAHEQMVKYASEAVSLEKSARGLIIGISIGVVLLSLLFGWLVSTGINRVLSRIIEGLNEGADQVAAASAQVSASSQSLAEGASEQAASIEETSSSLEEMASMTKQNAEHSTHADSLMKEAGTVVGKANEDMGELTGSMEEISKASEETSKIIKTIDEIAFQTNLLALNAAVEAARAGEAGAGFAVVADEVRNLAMRAADAAKNTSGLIEGTVKKIHEGSELVSRTNETFSEVEKSAGKVAELVGEIAAASNEQALGVEQVNLAVTEIDKVIQQNAANAEESASASEEMNAQAEQMRGIVGELSAMVNGSGNGRVTVRHSGNGKHGTLASKLGTRLPKAPKDRVEKEETEAKQLAAKPKEGVRPEEVIPMDDFKDF